MPDDPISERSADLERPLDALSVREIVGVMNRADAGVAERVAEHLEQLARAIEAIATRMRAGGRLIYVGAGTSGRLAQVDAIECVPTFNLPEGMVLAIVAGGRESLERSTEEAEDDAAAGQQAVIAHDVGAQDAVVGISASGQTPFVVGGLGVARERGALTVAVTCNRGTALSRVAHHAVELEVGPEIVAGSTRLKAGTAQKMVLNMISTATMVTLGKTYGGLMVDVQPRNQKLRARALRVVIQATGAMRDEAAAALVGADDDAKVAIVTLSAKCEPARAREVLARAGGSVRRALELSK